MKCRHCGKEIADNAVRCFYCGTYVDPDAEGTWGSPEARKKLKREKKLYKLLPVILALLILAAGVVFFVTRGVSSYKEEGTAMTSAAVTVTTTVASHTVPTVAATVAGTTAGA